MNEENKLKPCPFCGGAARLGREEDYCGLYLCYVECTKCSCRLHDEVEGMFVADSTLKALADEWNHRTSTPATKKEDEYDAGHAAEWMERNPHGWYDNEHDYGTDSETDQMINDCKEKSQSDN